MVVPLHNSSDSRSSASTRSVPAWALSVLFHALLLVALGLLIRTTKPKGAVEEPERAVSIVLTHTSPNAETTYFEDAPDSEQLLSQQNKLIAEPFEKSLPSAVNTTRLLPDVSLPEGGPLARLDGENPFFDPSATKGRPSRFLPDNANDQAIADAERNARIRGRPTGPVARVSVFGSAKAQGRSFAFVIDRSKSMGGDGLGVIEAAQVELAQALKGLEPEHKFQIVAYNQQTNHFDGRSLKLASGQNRERADRFVAGLVAYGSTEHQTAVMSALALKPDVIFLLTDGGYPELNAGQLRTIHRVAKGRTTIHCLRFGFGVEQESNHFMRRLAAGTGGTYLYVDMSKRR